MRWDQSSNLIDIEEDKKIEVGEKDLKKKKIYINEFCGYNYFQMLENDYILIFSI